jgi:hypothetical protein
MDLHAWLAAQVEAAERLVQEGGNPEAAASAIRRCEADRRILARHNVDPARADDRLFATACDGCGTYGDCDDPNTENINDCPELLDLAHAYGLTPETLATLDRPAAPPVKPIPGLTGTTLSERLASLLDRELANLADPGPAISGSAPLTAKKVGIFIRVSQEDLDHY